MWEEEAKAKQKTEKQGGKEMREQRQKGNDGAAQQEFVIGTSSVHW